MKTIPALLLRLAPLALILAARPVLAADADLILHGGKILTVDAAFSTQQAIAVQDGRIVAVGSNESVLKLRGAGTRVVDLAGKTVLPGLIDSHVHSVGASMTEFDHEIPAMETIADVLAHIRDRASKVKPGDWIHLSQVFITRLKESRYPTKDELDAAAPNNPVLYTTGPDAMCNSLALKLSGIDRNFKVTDGSGGFVELDPKTGEPTGVLRNSTRHVKSKGSKEKSPTEADRVARLKTLFQDYNAIGLTAICDRGGSTNSLALYGKLRSQGDLTVRIASSQSVGYLGEIEKIQQQIKNVAKDPHFTNPDAWIRVIGIKMFLDGGMLTGSAYMRQPWGVSAMYGISDPKYQGVRFISKDRLIPVVRTAVENGLQFTAHSVGDGAVSALVEAYEEVNRTTPVAATRPNITHCNFMTPEAIDKMAKLGVGCDIQPVWLYLDSRTLHQQFGEARTRWFQPLKTLFTKGVLTGGGSDHMQKVGPDRSVNPYNPFLGIGTAVTRRAKWFEGRMHAEEALTREQAIRFYTINNARLMFMEKDIGSLEKGKRADLVVLDRDILTCPENEIAAIKPVATYVDGKQVFARK